MTRLCVDRLRREARGPSYPGEWLPEPWVDPGPEQERIDETLSVALLATIRQLAPRARAVFLLHDVFGYAFDEIALRLPAKIILTDPPPPGYSAIGRLGPSPSGALRQGRPPAPGPRRASGRAHGACP